MTTPDTLHTGPHQGLLRLTNPAMGCSEYQYEHSFLFLVLQLDLLRPAQLYLLPTFLLGCLLLSYVFVKADFIFLGIKILLIL